jgi:hypothetical protein
MENILEVEIIFECIWIEIITKNSVFSVAAIYHPPGDYSYDAKYLIVDYLIGSCEQILLRDPNMNIIIAGDINKQNIHDLLSQQSLIQMVKTPTRCNNILDVFITNVSHYWKKVQVRKGLLKSDHNIITSQKDAIKAERTNLFFRDVRDHRKQGMFNDLDSVHWTKTINEELSSDGMATQFYETLWPKFETCFPLIKVLLSQIRTRCSQIV